MAPEALSSSPAPAPGSAEAKVAASASADVAATSWVMRGAGWGHSLGMSQYGAMEMAKDGYTAAQILKHYYTGTTYDARDRQPDPARQRAAPDDLVRGHPVGPGHGWWGVHGG